MGARGAAQAYECTRGAALQPLPLGYHRRQPEKGILHKVVRENLESFLAELREDGRDLPRFVEQELRRFLLCGMLSEGFVRCVCRSCGDELLVAFSCKGRGFCPSCCARRMSDTAAHLVDRVLPLIAYRQWVLAYPRRLRLAFAHHPRAAAESATIFLREVFRAQRKQARREGGKSPRVGAVCFTHRFGSRLDLNVHHHALLPDGVFTLGDDGVVGFVKLERPTIEGLERVLGRIVVKTLAMVRRRGLLDEEPPDALASVQAEALQTALPLGDLPRDDSRKLAVFLEGFSLQAGTHVHERDREGLEHLLRYALRPPLSVDRLSRAPDGKVLLSLRRPLSDGIQAVAFKPTQFLKRLAAIVPPPRVHSTRYFGVFAPRSHVRALLVPKSPKRRPRSCESPPNSSPQCLNHESLTFALRDELGFDPLALGPPPMPLRPRRLDWASLLQRVFALDVLQCPCGARRRVTAFIPSGRLACQILARLGIDATGPPLAPARARPRQEYFDLHPEDPGVDPQYPDS